MARALLAAAIAALVLSGCTATSTTVEAVDSATTQAASDVAPAPTTEPTAEPVAASCPYFPEERLPELAAGIDSVLPSATLDEAASSDPCVKRFSTADSWVELRFQAADENVVLFGDESLMTNGVDTTRAETSDGVLVDVVAWSSSPAAISTWDASLTGAFVLAGPPS